MSVTKSPAAASARGACSPLSHVAPGREHQHQGKPWEQAPGDGAGLSVEARHPPARPALGETAWPGPDFSPMRDAGQAPQAGSQAAQTKPR